jgi:hypothetical protein
LPNEAWPRAARRRPPFVEYFRRAQRARREGKQARTEFASSCAR